MGFLQKVAANPQQYLGTIMAGLAVALAIYNATMSAIAQIFVALKKQEPQWMQTAGAWGLKITQWITANTPTPPATPPSNSTQ